MDGRSRVRQRCTNGAGDDGGSQSSTLALTQHSMRTLSVRQGSRVVARFPALRGIAAACLIAAPAALAAQRAMSEVVPPSPNPDGFIADRTGLLDAAAIGRINALITEQRLTSGGDIGVALLADLGGRDASDVGVAIYRAWGIGTTDSIGSPFRDLGALLLIVPKEVAPSGQGDCWVTTGSGAEATLHDADAGAICRDVVIPALRELRYEDAVTNGVSAISGYLTLASEGNDARAAATDPRDWPTRFLPWLVGGSIIMMFLMPVLAIALIAGVIVALVMWRRHLRRRPRICPRGHGEMICLDEVADDAALEPGQRAEERVGSVDYDVWACRSCDERMVIPYRRWSMYESCPRCRYQTLKKTVTPLASVGGAAGAFERIELACANCGWHDVSIRVAPVSSGSGGHRGSSSGFSRSSSSHSSSSRSSFGGSGRTGGGGGGSRY